MGFLGTAVGRERQAAGVGLVFRSWGRGMLRGCLSRLCLHRACGFHRLLRLSHAFLVVTACQCERTHDKQRDIIRVLFHIISNAYRNLKILACFKPDGQIVVHESFGYAKGSNPQIFTQYFFGVVKNVGTGHGKAAKTDANRPRNRIVVDV